MSVTLAVALLLAGAVGTAVVLTRDLARQALTFGAYGLILAMAMFLLQAPDVALSQLVVGSIVLPVLLLVTITRVGRRSE
jgi:uncharacterized MnhB-related membrane protein